MFVKSIAVKIQPHYTARHDMIIREIEIKVQVSGGTEYTLTESMDDSDFENRLDWMFERARREIKSHIVHR